MAHLHTKICRSSHTSEKVAVQEILATIIDDDTRVIIYFASPLYNQATLASAFAEQLAVAMPGHNISHFGCTTAGELSNYGFSHDTLVAMSINSQRIQVGLGIYEGITSSPMNGGADALNRAALDLGTTLEAIKQKPGYSSNYFAFSLIDGLARVEEFVMLAMKGAAANIKIVGGSAADNMAFKHTVIHANGQTYTDAVLVALFETDLPFEIISTHHFVPTDTFFTVTNANSKERIVYEMDGDLASQVYAKHLGLSEEQLDDTVLHCNPVSIKQYGQYFLRSPMEILPDGSIRFACFIEYGEQVHLMQQCCLIETTREAMTNLQATLGTVTGMVCVNCAGRYSGIVANHLQEEITQILGFAPFIGFNSYGEQYNNLHMNQTLTLMAFGE